MSALSIAHIIGLESAAYCSVCVPTAAQMSIHALLYMCIPGLEVGVWRVLLVSSALTFT
jgi:hypothetical protein